MQNGTVFVTANIFCKFLLYWNTHKFYHCNNLKPVFWITTLKYQHKFRLLFLSDIKILSRDNRIFGLSRWRFFYPSPIGNFLKRTHFISSCLGATLNDKDDDSLPAETGQSHPFFRRSDSMTFLGCIPPNPFEVPLAEAIPLADQPHLLQVI